MHTFNNRTASRFNRIVPLYYKDKYVIKAIEKLSDEDKVKENAAKIRKKNINSSHINYVKNELPKKFKYSNNEKLLISNEILFNSFIIKALKEDEKLDIEDLDYINFSLKADLKEYNGKLIAEYIGLVKEASNKVLNTIDKPDDDKQIKDLKKEIEGKDARIKDQEKDIKLMDAKIKDQEKDIKVMDTKIKDQGKDIKVMDTKIKDQEKDIKVKDARIKDLEKDTKVLDNRIKEQEKEIKAKDIRIKRS